MLEALARLDAERPEEASARRTIPARPSVCIRTGAEEGVSPDGAVMILGAANLHRYVAPAATNASDLLARNAGPPGRGILTVEATR